MCNLKSCSSKLSSTCPDLAEIAWERGVSGLNTNTLSYKLRLNEGNTGLTRHQQAYISGLVLEGGSDIVSLYFFHHR
jgi:hypothetical protein